MNSETEKDLLRKLIEIGNRRKDIFTEIISSTADNLVLIDNCTEEVVIAFTEHDEEKLIKAVAKQKAMLKAVFDDLNNLVKILA